MLPFTRHEVDAALAYLTSQGWAEIVERWGGAAAMWITEAGRDAMDAGGVEATDARQSAPSVNNTFNMAGTGNVYATAAAPGASAIANVSSFDLQTAKAFVAAMRAAESDLNLTDEDRADLAQVEATEPGTDLAPAQRATARLYARADQVAMGTVGGILLALAKQALGLS